MKKTRLFFCLFVLLWVGPNGPLQADGASPDRASRKSLAPYEPDASHPFGRPNPEAPPELMQFDFMVGEFLCVDRTLQRDGSWNERRTVWTARYFMNGYAIQDIHWKPGVTATNLRFLDAATGKWQVSWFQIPPYKTAAVFEGAQEGEGSGGAMVMRGQPTTQEDKTVQTILTFYDIQPDSYEWKAEQHIDGHPQSFGPFWEISCVRSKDNK
jgi:hypothetical protein